MQQRKHRQGKQPPGSHTARRYRAGLGVRPLGPSHSASCREAETQRGTSLSHDSGQRPGQAWTRIQRLNFLSTIPTPPPGRKQSACWSPRSSGQPWYPQCFSEQADITLQVDTVGQRSRAQIQAAPFMGSPLCSES